jgi:hypothetical protein
MFRSRVIRLIVLGATLTVAAASFYTATAGAAPNGTFTMSYAGVCYLPHDQAYGGVAPFIATPAFRFNNTTGRTLTAREWLIVIDYSTGAQMRYRLVSDSQPIPSGYGIDYPAASIDLSFRSTQPFFWAAARVELDLYSNGVLYSTLTGIPPSYRIWDNNGYQTYHDTGRNQAYC